MNYPRIIMLWACLAAEQLGTAQSQPALTPVSPDDLIYHRFSGPLFDRRPADPAAPFICDSQGAGFWAFDARNQLWWSFSVVFSRPAPPPVPMGDKGEGIPFSHVDSFRVSFSVGSVMSPWPARSLRVGSLEFKYEPAPSGHNFVNGHSYTISNILSGRPTFEHRDPSNRLDKTATSINEPMLSNFRIGMDFCYPIYHSYATNFNQKNAERRADQQRANEVAAQEAEREAERSRQVRLAASKKVGDLVCLPNGFPVGNVERIVNGRLEVLGSAFTAIGSIPDMKWFKDSDVIVCNR